MVDTVHRALLAASLDSMYDVNTAAHPGGGPRIGAATLMGLARSLMQASCRKAQGAR